MLFPDSCPPGPPTHLDVSGKLTSKQGPWGAREGRGEEAGCAQELCHLRSSYPVMGGRSVEKRA